MAFSRAESQRAPLRHSPVTVITRPIDCLKGVQSRIVHGKKGYLALGDDDEEVVDEFGYSVYV